MPVDSWQFWDLGELDVVRPSQAALFRIFNALLLCRGRLHDSHSLEMRDGQWLYPPRSCSVLLRISLPVGEEARFEDLSGFRLRRPPQVHI